MNPQEFYATQSKFSDPGKYAYLFDDLPTDMDGLCRVVRGIYVHYMTEDFPPERKQEVDLRNISTILERVIAHENQPLTVKRPREKRVVGCCRDASLLLGAMLRHRGIPARTRIGFATYIRAGGEGYNVDHVVTEYWDAEARRWKLVDAEQNDYLIEHNHIDFDVHDIPRDRFLVGGKAWQMCRSGAADPQDFGSGRGDFFSGYWAIRNRLLLDLAALNKVEPLLWDTWGWMMYEFEPDEIETHALDEMAALTQGGDFEKIRQMYEAERFKAPPAVMSYSPAREPQQVTL